MIYKIAITGVGGTGKTTLIDELLRRPEFCEFKPIYSVSNRLAKEGHSVNGWMSDVTQTRMFYEHAVNAIIDGNHILDRCLVDAVAYCQYNSNILENVPLDVYNLGRKLMYENIQRYKLIVYCPIEFEPPKAKHRETDREYNEKVDGYIRDILRDFWHVEYVTGSVEERADQVCALF